MTSIPLGRCTAEAPYRVLGESSRSPMRFCITTPAVELCPNTHLKSSSHTQIPQRVEVPSEMYVDLVNQTSKGVWCEETDGSLWLARVPGALSAEKREALTKLSEQVWRSSWQAGRPWPLDCMLRRKSSLSFSWSPVTCNETSGTQSRSMSIVGTAAAAVTSCIRVDSFRSIYPRPLQPKPVTEYANLKLNKWNYHVEVWGIWYYSSLQIMEPQFVGPYWDPLQYILTHQALPKDPGT